jgi:hypothetical protein
MRPVSDFDLLYVAYFPSDLFRYCCRFLRFSLGWVKPSAGKTSAESFDDFSPRHPRGCHPRGPALFVSETGAFPLSNC